MSNSKSVRASCLCGKSTFELTLSPESLPLQTNVCHCNPCRHVSGALFVTYARLPDDFKPPRDIVSRLKVYKTSAHLTRFFCPDCGTHMLVVNEQKGYWRVASGCLEQADGIIQPMWHIYIEDTKDGGLSDWLPEINGKILPRYRETIGSDEVPPGWSLSTSSAKPSPSDKLYAHCACKGVEFFISRPSAKSEETQGPWPDALIPFNSDAPHPPNTEPWWLRADKQKFLASTCTCDSCRLATGHEVHQWSFVPTSDISLMRDGSQPFIPKFGTLTSFESSDDVVRRFCSECGATVFWHGNSRPSLIDVAVGLYAAPEGARAESWLEWSTNRVSYREDSTQRAEAFTTAFEAGMKGFGKRKAPE